ncbi:MAG: cation transporter [Betaproteobacteria bacterium]|nr:cation transporter [Betaproteobacteria bacterium]
MNENDSLRSGKQRVPGESAASTPVLDAPRVRLTHYAWLSLATSLVVIVLKVSAWWVTGSVALLSDALESGVNLVAACVALASLAYASQAPDADHPFGHDKVEFFSSGLEGGLIFVAAGLILWTSVPRLWAPVPIESAGLGLVLAVIASVANAVCAGILLRAGRRHRSITLEADGRHLMTDVWTTAGVVAGLMLVAATGLHWLDAVIAIVVGLHILAEGWRLMRRSFDGLMDRSIPDDELARVRAVLDRLRDGGNDYHALRTRQAGRRHFIDVHVLVPGALSVQAGHDLVEQVEADLRAAVPHAEVLIHLEPLEDPRAWSDHPA